MVASDGWLNAERESLVVDPSAPTTSVLVRLPDMAPQRFTLNLSHTVRDVRAQVERAFRDAGVEPRPFALLAGYPPRPIDVAGDDVTLESAKLANAAITHRWA